MKADEIKMEVEIRMPRFKKTRRGKKRRFNTDGDANNPSHSPPLVADVKSPKFRSLEPLEQNLERKNCSRNSLAELPPEGATVAAQNGGSFKRPMLRPLDVPKAPNNSTQFIMDDHENCQLYVSFESPRRRRSSGSEGHSPCTGYRDIDYEYESPDDVDTTAFFEKDFETIYRRAREDELMTLTRVELIQQLVELEERVSSYELLLAGSLPSVAQLQEELLKMQEDNARLRNTNWCLSEGRANSTDSDLGDDEVEELSDVRDRSQSYEEDGSSHP